MSQQLAGQRVWVCVWYPPAVAPVLQGRPLSPPAARSFCFDGGLSAPMQWPWPPVQSAPWWNVWCA
eukprot:2709124-Rhodomonas_salina.1